MATASNQYQLQGKPILASHQASADAGPTKQISEAVAVILQADAQSGTTERFIQF